MTLSKLFHLLNLGFHICPKEFLNLSYWLTGVIRGRHTQGLTHSRPFRKDLVGDDGTGEVVGGGVGVGWVGDGVFLSSVQTWLPCAA